MGKIGRLWRTVRYLKARQIAGRAYARLWRPRLNVSQSAPLREIEANFIAPARRRPSMHGPGSFEFLNELGSLQDDGWDGPAKSKLWRYNQHYFDDLNAEGALDRRKIHHALIMQWIDENRPAQGVGWEPYPTSLRIVNWIKWALGGEFLSEREIHSLAVQARWLSKRVEWHLLGNHLFANAKALTFAGCFFAGPEAEGWLAQGLWILRREIPEQFLSDGAHFERSPMYHALALEDVLDLINLAREFGVDELANVLAPHVTGMMQWLLDLSHPDGRFSFFNDAAFGVAPDTAELFSYAERLGFKPPRKAAGCVLHAPSGYARLESGDATVLADLAPIGPDYLPGHAHADTLSFEMSLRKIRLIVNSGTSVYGVGPERHEQRATAAHSTIEIDERSSSEIWSGFRVGRRARTFDATVHCFDTHLEASGNHDGYRHLHGAPIHHRSWKLEPDRLVLADRIDGRGNHSICSYLHLGPDITARAEDTGKISLFDESGNRLAGLIIRGGDVAVSPSSWHPEFGLSIETQKISITAAGPMPLALTSIIEWRSP